MMEGSHRISRGTPCDAWHGQEAQTSGGGRQMGSPSRGTVVPHPGNMGGGKVGVKIERSGGDG